jgi:hypothetical protein
MARTARTARMACMGARAAWRRPAWACDCQQLLTKSLAPRAPSASKPFQKTRDFLVSNKLGHCTPGADPLPAAAEPFRHGSEAHKVGPAHVWPRPHPDADPRSAPLAGAVWCVRKGSCRGILVHQGLGVAGARCATWGCSHRALPRPHPRAQAASWARLDVAAAVAAQGFDVVVSDIDALWFRDPTLYVAERVPPAADLVVASDQARLGSARPHARAAGARRAALAGLAWCHLPHAIAHARPLAAGMPRPPRTRAPAQPHAPFSLRRSRLVMPRATTGSSQTPRQITTCTPA